MKNKGKNNTCCVYNFVQCIYTVLLLLLLLLVVVVVVEVLIVDILF